MLVLTVVIKAIPLSSFVLMKIIMKLYIVKFVSVLINQYIYTLVKVVVPQT